MSEMKKQVVSRCHKLNHANGADVLITILMTVLAIIVLYPFYNAVLLSIVPQHEYLRTPFMLWPKTIDLTSYAYIFNAGTILSGMKVTVVILVLGVLYNMTLTVLTAYAMTKPYPGRKLINALIIFTMYFGGGLIPFYLLIKDLGLIDSIFSMILPTGISFSYMIIIRRHFEAIPKELEESASLDGASDLRILWSLFLPLSLPILATFCLYYGVERWNEWWNGMLFIKSSYKQPLQLVLRNIINNAESVDDGTAIDAVVFGDGVKMAATVVTMVPIMCLYPFLQRYFVTGLTAGAVKG